MKNKIFSIYKNWLMHEKIVYTPKYERKMKKMLKSQKIFLNELSKYQKILFFEYIDIVEMLEEMREKEAFVSGFNKGIENKSL